MTACILISFCFSPSSVGTANQVRQRRDRYLARLSDIIDEDERIAKRHASEMRSLIEGMRSGDPGPATLAQQQDLTKTGTDPTGIDSAETGNENYGGGGDGNGGDDDGDDDDDDDDDNGGDKDDQTRNSNDK
jgi:hypothetical protein